MFIIVIYYTLSYNIIKYFHIYKKIRNKDNCDNLRIYTKDFTNISESFYELKFGITVFTEGKF